MIAKLLAAGMLPGTWICDEQTRILRRQVTRRSQLVRGRTRARNQIHAIVIKSWIEGSCAHIGVRFCRWDLTALAGRVTASKVAPRCRSVIPDRENPHDPPPKSDRRSAPRTRF